MIIKLPIKPMSINVAWQGQRFKTKQYVKFQNDCLNLLIVSGAAQNSIKGLVEVRYNWYIKNFSRSDVDNFIKPLQDILVKRGIIEDDRYIKRVIAEKFQVDSENEERIEIDIKEYEGQ